MARQKTFKVIRKTVLENSELSCAFKNEKKCAKLVYEVEQKMLDTCYA